MPGELPDMELMILQPMVDFEKGVGRVISGYLASSTLKINIIITEHSLVIICRPQDGRYLIITHNAEVVTFHKDLVQFSLYEGL